MNVIYMPSMYAIETPLPFLILSFHVCHRSPSSLSQPPCWAPCWHVFSKKNTRARSARASERTPASSKLGNISHFRVDVMLCTK